MIDRCTQCGSYDLADPGEESPLCYTCYERIYPSRIAWMPEQCTRCGSKEFIEKGTMEYTQTITLDENGELHWGEFQNDGESEREQSYWCAQCGRNLQTNDDDEDDEPDMDDDFPMSVEYDGLYGAPDFIVEQSAQDEARYEAGDYPF
jgi:DNA-directed RNA polymerase subunit RPC12/RpoP